jgi:hypothetical protein
MGQKSFCQRCELERFYFNIRIGCFRVGHVVVDRSALHQAGLLLMGPRMEACHPVVLPGSLDWSLVDLVAHRKLVPGGALLATHPWPHQQGLEDRLA